MEGLRLNLNLTLSLTQTSPDSGPSVSFHHFLKALEECGCTLPMTPGWPSLPAQTPCDEIQDGIRKEKESEKKWIFIKFLEHPRHFKCIIAFARTALRINTCFCTFFRERNWGLWVGVIFLPESFPIVNDNVLIFLHSLPTDVPIVPEAGSATSLPSDQPGTRWAEVPTWLL